MHAKVQLTESVPDSIYKLRGGGGHCAITSQQGLTFECLWFVLLLEWRCIIVQLQSIRIEDECLMHMLFVLYQILCIISVSWILCAASYFSR